MDLIIEESSEKRKIDIKIFFQKNQAWQDQKMADPKKKLINKEKYLINKGKTKGLKSQTVEIRVF